MPLDTSCQTDIVVYAGILGFSVLTWLFFRSKRVHFWKKYLLNVYKIYFHKRKVPVKRLSNYDKITKANATVEELGLVSSPEEYGWENPRTSEKGVCDGIYFTGVDAHNNVFDVGVNNIGNNLTSAWITLYISGHGVFQLPSQPDTRVVYKGNDASFDAGGLQIKCILPIRRWRISFNGLLKKGVSTGEGKNSREQLVHVKFSFLWSGFTLVHDILAQYETKELANSFAKTKSDISEKDLAEFEEAQNRYEQWGQLMGTLQIEGADPIELFLWSARTRILDKPRWDSNDVSVKMYAYFKDGIPLKIEITSMENLISNHMQGYWTTAGGKENSISNCDLNVEQLRDLKKKNLTISFHRNRQQEKALVTFNPDNTELYIGPCNERVLAIRPFTIRMAEEEGYGIIHHSFKALRRGEEFSKFPRIILKATENCPNKESFVLSLEDPSCQILPLSGGKGCSLALLTLASKQLKEFSVPKGVVVTTASYEDHVTSQKYLSEAVQLLADTLRSNNTEKIKVSCERTSAIFAQASLSSALKSETAKQLLLQFETIAEKRFAVRSSAVGEDGDEMSAAGQMLTLLGVRGLENIYEAVVKCWSSKFRFEAVQYFRQHGFQVGCPMAVVIQEMVPADVAGVMFTVDPVSGNPLYPCITANYGLGETVVSSSAEPDTYTLKRREDNTVEVHVKIVGSKKMKMIMRDEGGTEEETIPDGSEEFCLSEDLAIEIGNIGLLIEECYCGARDIEWAVQGNKIFLLQARPVTTLHTETLFELNHEFDTPLRSSYEYLTRANTGEVFLGAATPLGISLVVSGMDIYGQRNFITRQKPENFDYVPYYIHWLPVTHRQVTISVTDTIFRLNDSEVTASQKAFLVAIFGRVVEMEEMHRFGVKKYGLVSRTQKFFHLAMLSLLSFRIPHLIKSMSEKVGILSIDVKQLSTSYEAYTSLCNQLPFYGELCGIHGLATYMSSLYNVMVLYVLSKEKKDWDNELYCDFATLLSSCSGVESAEVPASLQELASAIFEEHGKKFSTVPTDVAYTLLQNGGPGCRKFEEFLKKHGHRCVKEFDVASISWGMQPLFLVDILQNLVKSIDIIKAKKKDTKSVDNAIQELKTPLTRVGKRFLKIVLPWGRDAVGHREQTKSLVIKLVDWLRRTCHRLGYLFVQEGLLPDGDLIFFLTMDEIKLMVDRQYTGIVAKAIRRRQIHSKLDTLQFPEIMIGIPKPIVNEGMIQHKSSFVLKGTPVCQGTVKAKVRVVLHLQEAAFLESGEVLVTHSTDIGWSPYFPLLSGVVTVLGGLISHGAVVAREYGLPCVVGVQNATQLLKSGDLIILDGTKGTITKLDEDNELNDL